MKNRNLVLSLSLVAIILSGCIPDPFAPIGKEISVERFVEIAQENEKKTLDLFSSVIVTTKLIRDDITGDTEPVEMARESIIKDLEIGKPKVETYYVSDSTDVSILLGFRLHYEHLSQMVENGSTQDGLEFKASFYTKDDELQVLATQTMSRDQEEAVGNISQDTMYHYNQYNWPVKYVNSTLGQTTYSIPDELVGFVSINTSVEIIYEYIK